MIQLAANLLLAALAAAAHPGEDDRRVESSETATLTGTVVLGETDRAAESFAVFVRSPSARQVRTIRGEGGRFSAAMEPGRYEIAIVAPGFDILCRTLDVQEGDRNTLRVVRLAAGSARLTVDLRDVAGAPLAGHRVHLVRAFLPSRDLGCEGSAEARPNVEDRIEDGGIAETADAAGRVTFSEVPSGPAAIVVEPPAGLSWPPQFLVVYQGEARDLVMEQSPPCTLAVRVMGRDKQSRLPDLIQVERDSDGFGVHATCGANFCCDVLQAAPIAAIAGVPFPRLSRHYHVWVPGPSGDEDSVRLAGLTPGTWRVRVRVDGTFLPATTLELTGSMTQLDLAVPDTDPAGDSQTVAVR
jgi:hypothetical protein